MNTYQPELGQMVFGQPTKEWGIPYYAESLIDGLARRWGITYWNINQKEWSDCMPLDLGKLHVRPYSWDDEDAGDNLWLDNHPLRIRWYKHLGRGMSANAHLEPAEWAKWHDLVIAEIWAAEPKDY